MRDWHISHTRDDYHGIRRALAKDGNRVQADQWQSTAQVDPMKQVIEFEFCTVVYDMPPDTAILRSELTPNLPWAEEHFQERVSGVPLNPPPSHVRWPFAQATGANDLANGLHMSDERFSHSYPERLWSHDRYITAPPSDMFDIRSVKPFDAQPLAHLSDLVQLLADHPTTRQAFIPIWWPIDGKMAEKERVPCTIGYHFLLRDGMLHCHYFMRSCDAMRHLPDDLYMAARLTQWMCEQLNDYWRANNHFAGLQPGRLVMQITSLHIFEGDLAVIAFQDGQR